MMKIFGLISSSLINFRGVLRWRECHCKACLCDTELAQCLSAYRCPYDDANLVYSKENRNKDRQYLSQSDCKTKPIDVSNYLSWKRLNCFMMLPNVVLGHNWSLLVSKHVTAIKRTVETFWNRLVHILTKLKKVNIRKVAKLIAFLSNIRVLYSWNIWFFLTIILMFL